jgi:hypothetical protein
MAAPLVTTGTYSYSQSVSTICTAALRLTQAIGEEETANAAQMETTIDALSGMVKGWMGSDIHVWCEEEGILFLQPGQTQYEIGAGSSDHIALFQNVTFGALASAAGTGASTVTLASVTDILPGDQFGVQLDSGVNFWTTVNGAPAGNVVTLTAPLPSPASAAAITFDYTTPLFRPLKALAGRRYQYNSRLDIPIQTWSRLDYAAQPNKFTPGITTAYFYDPQTGQGSYQSNNPIGLMNAWPTPADNGYAMRNTFQRPIQDAGTVASVLDFPVEWNAAIKWNLAGEIGPIYGCPMEQMQIIAAQATRWFKMASAWDRESEGVRFGVARRAGYRRG